MRIWNVDGIGIRQTVVSHGGVDILVSTCSLHENYPYETGVFFTLDMGESLNGEVPFKYNSAIMRGYSIEEAYDNHIDGIMFAIDYLHGRDV